MRLLTLQVLSQLCAGAAGARRADGPADFNEYAFRLLGGGSGGGGGTAGERGLDVGGRGGSAQMLRIHQATQRDPKARTTHFNAHTQRKLGTEELGSGWSAAEYGRRKVDLTGCPDMEHAYYLLADVR